MPANIRLPFATTLEVGTSLNNRTGSWRTQKPVYVDRLPPCNHACPAGENIQAWLYLVEEKQYEAAWQKIVEENPFPAIHGRVCYHPCESGCNRNKHDEPVSIHAIERFLGDEAIKHGWMPKVGAPTGKKILIVGAGPSGLSAAFHLARMGHTVTVRDSGEKPGGMMRYGIPKYRLPRDILDAEVERLTKMGVVFLQNDNIDDLDAVMKKDKYDSVFLAVGAGLSKKVNIPTVHASKVMDALHVLKQVESNPENPPMLGRRVAVYGGGNTAMDAARTAIRLGAEDVVVVYRRDRKRMPAHEFEVIEAEEEGVKMKWLSTIQDVGEGVIKIEKMRLNEKGLAEPTGEFEELDADTVLLAIGQDAATGFLRNVEGLKFEKDGCVLVDDQMMTGRPGVFAGGDMSSNNRTVTVAVGGGKRAARCIDAYLKGTTYGKKYTLNGKKEADLPVKEIATFDKLNTWYYTDAPKHVQTRLNELRRWLSFDEVVHGLTAEDATNESRRCLSCGNCFECDNCYGVCPDNAVVKLGPGNRFEFNYDYCKGCGICSTECPAGAIKMVEEEI